MKFFTYSQNSVHNFIHDMHILERRVAGGYVVGKVLKETHTNFLAVV